MPLYLDSDNDKDSYLVSELFFKEQPPIGQWLTVKELKEQYGFNPWLGSSPQAGRYIVREYGKDV